MKLIPSNNYNSKKTTQAKQEGSALMLTLFIIIVLTLLGGALMKILSTSSESIAQEVIGTRAYMAANSAMQAELQKLFPLKTGTAPSPPQCNENIIGDFNHDFSVVGGLYHCKAKTSCKLYATHLPTNERFYRLTSIGKCASSALASDSKSIVVSSRKIQVEARDL
tara:strand:+ start:1559 stop:2056 length:498 start_codon:yes stop_codon:yes gene_type:complete